MFNQFKPQRHEDTKGTQRSKKKVICLLRVSFVSLCLCGCPFLPAADPPASGVAFPTKTFSLEKDSLTLGQALDELAKQTGVAVGRERLEAERPLKLKCDKLPFWAALEQIAKESDHKIQTLDQGKKVALVGGPNDTYRELPAAFDGPFRIVAKRVTGVDDLERGQAYTEVTLDMYWEPGMHVFLVESPGKTITAKDNTDRDLATSDRGEGRLAVSGGFISLPVRLNEVPRSAKTIKLLEGSLSVIGAPSMTTFEFGKLGDKDEQQTKKDGITVKMKPDCTFGSDLWAVKVEFEYPEGGPQLESFEAGAWLLENDAHLVSTDGKYKMPVNGGYELLAQSDRKASLVYRFTDADDRKLGKTADWRLVLTTPAKLVEGKVKFKLENIPLP